jgi:hypothetical protein
MMLAWLNEPVLAGDLHVPVESERAPRLKMLNRQMYGRAGSALLQKLERSLGVDACLNLWQVKTSVMHLPQDGGRDNGPLSLAQAIAFVPLGPDALIQAGLG